MMTRWWYALALALMIPVASAFALEAGEESSYREMAEKLARENQVEFFNAQVIFRGERAGKARFFINRATKVGYVAVGLEREGSGFRKMRILWRTSATELYDPDEDNLDVKTLIFSAGNVKEMAAQCKELVGNARGACAPMAVYLGSEFKQGRGLFMQGKDKRGLIMSALVDRATAEVSIFTTWPSAMTIRSQAYAEGRYTDAGRRYINK